MKKFYIFLLNTLLFLGLIICFDYHKAQNAYNNYFEKLKKQYPTVKENPCNRDFYYSLRMLSFDKIYFEFVILKATKSYSDLRENA